MTGESFRMIRRRIDHVASTVETVESHIEAEADNRALVRALGILEQIQADLDELEAD